MSSKYKFSDIDLDFGKNPVSGDINMVKDDVAIKRSVRNLVLTSRLERLFQPEIDCRLSQSLFENMTPVTEVRMEQAIRYTLNRYEPRIEVVDIVVGARQEANAVSITIAFRIKNTQEVIEVPIRLERTR